MNGTPLLRIRNPWGNAQEWNGAWSDQSAEWNSIDEETKRSIGLDVEHDGESWFVFYELTVFFSNYTYYNGNCRMSFSDFMTQFEKLEVCNLGPEVMAEIEEMTGVAKVSEELQSDTITM